jgi:hypothetical protein
MKDTTDYRKELQQDYARRRDLKRRKYSALSRYDIQIAFSGNKYLAYCTSMYLKKNHIKYHLARLEEQREVKPQARKTISQQLTLF